MRLARFARVRLLRHALPISLLILREKKPTVLQSNNTFPWSVLLSTLEMTSKGEPLACGSCFHLQSFEHFDVISMVDMDKDQAKNVVNLCFFFSITLTVLTSISVKVSWNIARERKRKTNCFTITSLGSLKSDVF